MIHIPVTWPASLLVLQAGQGEVIEWNLTLRERTGTGAYRETTSHCGIVLPDLTGSVLASFQKFGIRFPNELFDTPLLPTAAYDSTLSAAGVWDAGPVVLLTGLALSDPLNTPWPASFTPDQTPDQDHDGLPGVTVVAVDPSTDPSYNWPPVGLPAQLGMDYPRAAKIGVVVRTIASLHGTAANCDALQGAVRVSTINGKPALNNTVVGCRKTAGGTCSAAEIQFLNNERPQFTPSAAGTLVSVRIPSGSGCPTVRAQLVQ